MNLLDAYLQEPRNEALSEHEHYGPYMYLKLQTAESAEIDSESIRGSLADLARLRDLIADALRALRPGESRLVGPEYSQNARFSLRLEMREPGFDPACADPTLPESGGLESSA